MTEARWACAECGGQWAPGAPCCPRCRSTKHTENAEEDGMLKIDRDGRVSDSADVAALEGQLDQHEAEIAELRATEAQEHPGTGEPMTGVEAPADGTMSPLVGNEHLEGSPEPAATVTPAAPRPSRVPPRRTPPPGGAGG